MTTITSGTAVISDDEAMPREIKDAYIQSDPIRTATSPAMGSLSPRTSPPSCPTWWSAIDRSSST
jgi:hypothetical protein